MKPIIEVCGISKRYKLGQIQGYKTFRDSFSQLFSPKNSLSPKGRGEGEGVESKNFIWALKDVSFDVQLGEVIGIIGRNGSGKSTLLKILTRITEPTEGTARIRGQVASMLEVGTGFHPELTGRENVYLNGAILGMRKADIDKKFDEIIAFAEVERFVDTPVKRYSSGMYVRLAFAVAAHLEPEILLVDEVLAVGDFEFQKKCLGKMGDVAKEGRTILFVSHNMATIAFLCSRTILLEEGKVIMNGPSKEIIEQYLNILPQIACNPLSARKDRKGTGLVRFTDIWLEDKNGQVVKNVCSGQDVAIAVSYESNSETSIRNFYVAFALKSLLNEPISDLRSDSTEYFRETSVPLKGKIICKLPKIPLNAGRYHFNAFCMINGVIADWVENAKEMLVEEGDFFGTGKLSGKDHGPFLFEQEWSIVNE